MAIGFNRDGNRRIVDAVKRIEQTEAGDPPSVLHFFMQSFPQAIHILHLFR